MNPLSVMNSVVLMSLLAFVGAEVENESQLTKLWAVSGIAHGTGRTAVVDVNGGSVTVQPSSYNGRQSKMAAEFNAYNMAKRYAFKPRSAPKSEAQIERSIHYTTDEEKKQNAEILFPGNYFPIADVKKENKSEDTFNPLSGGPFHPKPIPLFRNEYERSLDADEDEEANIEKPDEVGQTASRRSLSTLFDGEDEDADDDEDVDLEDDDDTVAAKKKGPSHYISHKLKSGKKYAKYMLPLLLAYKLKFFSMIPLMMGGLVLLVGATGMAGFFFALFAAVMGLQKGSY